MTESEGDQETPTLIEVRKVGDSVASILPREMLARLNLKEGDTLHAVAHPDGGLTLSAPDPVHARGMELARQAFNDYAEAFKALAKRPSRSGSARSSS